MFETLLHTVPYALVNAASPTIPVAAIALMAIPGRGRRAILWYLVGCTLVVVVATALVLTVFSNVDLSSRLRVDLPNWADAIIGVLAIGFGLRLWRRGPRPANSAGRSWEHLGPLAIIGVGVYMELINLVTPPAYLTGIMLATQKQLSSSDLMVVVAISAVIVLLPVWGLALISAFAPQRTDAAIADLQAFFHRYGHPTLIVVFLAVGAFLIARSLWAVLA